MLQANKPFMQQQASRNNCLENTIVKHMQVGIREYTQHGFWKGNYAFFRLGEFYNNNGELRINC